MQGLLGRVQDLELKRRFGEAVALLERFADAHGGTPLARVALGHAARLRGRAEKAFEKEVESAKGLVGEGRYAEAADVYRRASELLRLPSIVDSARREIILLELAAERSGRRGP
jgi:hypothetical protein